MLCCGESKNECCYGEGMRKACCFGGGMQCYFGGGIYSLLDDECMPLGEGIHAVVGLNVSFMKGSNACCCGGGMLAAVRRIKECKLL
jgi:hypothetical protein